MTVAVTVLLVGCAKNTGTSPRDTGGGGVSWYEDHSSRRPGAVGTGSSAANGGLGAVGGSGAMDEPGNADSATESNGGQGAEGNPNSVI